jgi:hypothetical protein
MDGDDWVRHIQFVGCNWYGLDETVLFYVLVYSNNLNESQNALTMGILSRILGEQSVLSKRSVFEYSEITHFVRGDLFRFLNSTEALAASSILNQNPHALLSVYYKLNIDDWLLMGPTQMSEITIPSSFVSPCHKIPLVESLNISCMPAYQISNTGRLVHGKLSSYSVNDGITRLVYDLSNYTAGTDSRMISIEFNIYDVPRANIGIVQIVFERTGLGSIISRYSVVSVPQHFVYLGGTGSTSEWLLVVGQISILVGVISALFVLCIYKVRNHSVLVWPAYWEVLVVVIAVTSIVSFGLQFSMMISTPLAGVNLGTLRSVALSEVAERFITVNAINAFTIVLLLGLFVSMFLSNTTLRDWLLVFSVCVSVMVLTAVVLNLRFADCLSFTSSFMLLIKVSLRYISTDDFNFLFRNGYAMAAMLMFYSLAFFWLTGVVIGTLLPVKTSLENNQEKVEEKKAEKPTISVESNEEQTIASVEVFAGRMLTDVALMKEQIESELQSARADLVETRAKIGQIRQLVSKTSQPNK